VKQANPDLLFVAWAGTTAPAMWRALEQQGAFGVSNKITTGPRRAGDLVDVR
jgi:branched-chain amino acid transport system substrate-binding protein